MNVDLAEMAGKLSESDIRDLLRLKKRGGRKLAVLQKRKARLASQMEKLDSEIAAIAGGGEDSQAKAPARRGRGRKARKSEPEKTEKTERKTAPRRRASRSPDDKRVSTGLSAAIRTVFQKSRKPLRSGEIVKKLPSVGFEVADAGAVRKKVSSVLATQKASFEQVGRGLYKMAQ